MTRCCLLLLLAVVACDAAPRPSLDGPVAGWSRVGGDPDGTRYSPLDQIDRDNVRHLEVAWTYRTGDLEGERPGVRKTAFQATPILDGSTLYFCSPLNRIFAIDAETGAELWVHDPQARAAPTFTWSRTCRGVALWRGPDGEAPCTRRIFAGTLDARLIAVDAATGERCRDFGVDGEVDLTLGLGEIEPGEYYPTSAPAVVGDIVTIGALVADNRRVNPPGGVLRGYDVRSGSVRWAFDPVPPGTPPLDPAPDGSPRYHRGTPNVWSLFAVDAERGWIFAPFGGPSPDFFGGHRGGADHYGSALVALDGATGEVQWRFQVVHHDLWDYDVASPPNLIELEIGGRRVEAVAQPTKMGLLFLLDRETGEPLYPVEERPVAQTDVEGEITSPTQPFPTFPPPLHELRLDPEDAFGFTPYDRGACRQRIAALRNEGIYTPPSLRGSVLFPGTAGGSNWGGAAWEPERGLLVMNQNRIAQSITLVPRSAADAVDLDRVSDLRGTPYLARMEVLLSPFGAPCSPPPWGTLFALDLKTGEKRWEIPFGTVRDMTPLPVPWQLGMPSMGGPIVTAGGVAFIGASMDDYLRGYDVETGEELWKARLPAGGQATPMTYRTRRDGRQFVVIAAGGHGTMGTRPGDSVIAYALPESAEQAE